MAQQQDVRDEPRPSNDSRSRKPVEASKPVAVKSEPSRGQRWSEAQPTKMILLWAILGAAVLTIAVGFIWGGWVTGGGSTKAGVQVGKDAVIERLAPICVAQFNQDPDNAAKLEELKGMTVYKRNQYIQDQGWATMPGEASPDRNVADACATLLLQATP